MGIPRVGGAEKLKLQEAIPPFSLIEDSIHGKSAATLVKMEKLCWSHGASPGLSLTIPTRVWTSPFATVSGPPLSPWVLSMGEFETDVCEKYLTGPRLAISRTHNQVFVQTFTLT